jgi:hypothetical protein
LNDDLDPSFARAVARGLRHLRGAAELRMPDDEERLHREKKGGRVRPPSHRHDGSSRRRRRCSLRVSTICSGSSAACARGGRTRFGRATRASSATARRVMARLDELEPDRAAACA